MDEKSGQGAAVVIIVAIVAAVVAGAIVYVVKPTPVSPEIAELEAQISDLEAEIADLEGQIPTPLDPIKVAFVCHGVADDACWMAYHNGAVALAERLRNVEVTYHYAAGDLPAQIDMIELQIAAGVDAIVTTIVDDLAFDAPIQAARDAGIVVIAYDCDDTEAAAGNPRQAFITSMVKKGLCYDTSYVRAELALDYFDGVLPEDCLIYGPCCAPGEGWSNLSVQGIVEYLAEQGYVRDVDYTLDVQDISLDAAEAEARTTTYVTANRDEIDVIIPIGGMGSVSAVQAEESLEMVPGEIPIFSWPHGPVDVRGIESGLVIAGVTDSHSSVGAICLYEAVMAVQFNVGPVDVAMPLVVVDQSNIAQWAAGWESCLY